MKDEGTLDADEPGFRDRLATLIDTAEDRRENLRTIEKTKIGRNAKRVKELTIERKLIEEGKVKGSIEAIDSELESLQADPERTRVRERLEADALVVESADGREITILAMDLLHVFRANEAGFFGRVGEMFRRIWTFLSSDPRNANMDGGV